MNIKNYLRSLHHPVQVIDLRNGELITVFAVGKQDALLQVCAVRDGSRVCNETEFTYHKDTIGFGWYITTKADDIDMVAMASNWAEWIKGVA